MYDVAAKKDLKAKESIWKEEAQLRFQEIRPHILDLLEKNKLTEEEFLCGLTIIIDQKFPQDEYFAKIQDIELPKTLKKVELESNKKPEPKKDDKYLVQMLMNVRKKEIFLQNKMKNIFEPKMENSVDPEIQYAKECHKNAGLPILRMTQV